MEDEPLAHSPKKDVPAQTYKVHVTNVFDRASCNAKRAASFYAGKKERLVRDVEAAALFHDLGKLDARNQAILRGISKGKLSVPHEDAGIAHLWSLRFYEAAHLVAAHHAGLANWEHSDEKPDCLWKPKENDQGEPWHLETKRHLGEYIKNHREKARCSDLELLVSGGGLYKKAGLLRRIALSCLVDADHGDTARNYGGEKESVPPATRWEERLKALDEYVGELAKTALGENRTELRAEVYVTCRDAAIGSSIRSCEAVVGSGKTTAIMAHLLRVAQEKELRHIIVVLPYTNIITQSVETYRKALTLPGENPEEIVAEHHHKADFGSLDARQLATLWQAPIIVTTAVQFFETLASNHPSRLRKLHELPGSAVFVDESHAAIPTALWKQTWRWLETWTTYWGGYLVLASGSLVKFWTIPELVPETPEIHDLIGPTLRKKLQDAENRRIRYERISEPLNVEALIGKVTKANGPCLVIVNTVQSAAVVARAMRAANHDVLHLSTALAPAHREIIVNRIKERLKYDLSKWTLVATSCVEAGMNFSFHTGFRETSTAASLIQAGGRVGREAEYGDAVIYDFRLEDNLITKNPAFNTSVEILSDFFNKKLMKNPESISELMLKAMNQELHGGDLEKAEKIVSLEDQMNYPSVSKEYRVIDAVTSTVVIDPEIIQKFQEDPWAKISRRELQQYSVQIWSYKIERKELQIKLLKGDPEDHDALYHWSEKYDPDFLGYMEGALPILENVLRIKHDGCIFA